MCHVASHVSVGFEVSVRIGQIRAPLATLRWHAYISSVPSVLDAQAVNRRVSDGRTFNQWGSTLHANSQHVATTSM